MVGMAKIVGKALQKPAPRRRWPCQRDLRPPGAGATRRHVRVARSQGFRGYGAFSWSASVIRSGMPWRRNRSLSRSIVQRIASPSADAGSSSRDTWHAHRRRRSRGGGWPRRCGTPRRSGRTGSARRPAAWCVGSQIWVASDPTPLTSITRKPVPRRKDGDRSEAHVDTAEMELRQCTGQSVDGLGQRRGHQARRRPGRSSLCSDCRQRQAASLRPGPAPVEPVGQRSRYRCGTSRARSSARMSARRVERPSPTTTGGCLIVSEVMRPTASSGWRT